MVSEDRWKWISGEKIALESCYWGLFGGKQMPWNDEAYATVSKFLTLYQKDDKTTFANWDKGTRKFICQNYGGDDGKP